MNERLARHYGIPNVAGAEFRRVQYPDDRRGGLLGQGSVLTLTSLANRTSPVLRGKWVMEVLLGIAAAAAAAERARPRRDRRTRRTAGCSRRASAWSSTARTRRARSCHRFIDPIGLALENFDVTGALAHPRERHAGSTRAATSTTARRSTTPAELRRALLKRPTPLVRTFTENLMTYALGRRVEYYDMPTVRAIARRPRRTDYRIVVVHPRAS